MYWRACVLLCHPLSFKHLSAHLRNTWQRGHPSWSHIHWFQHCITTFIFLQIRHNTCNLIMQITKVILKWIPLNFKWSKLSIQNDMSPMRHSNCHRMAWLIIHEKTHNFAVLPGDKFTTLLPNFVFNFTALPHSSTAMTKFIMTYSYHQQPDYCFPITLKNATCMFFQKPTPSMVQNIFFSILASSWDKFNIKHNMLAT